MCCDTFYCKNKMYEHVAIDLTSPPIWSQSSYIHTQGHVHTHTRGHTQFCWLLISSDEQWFWRLPVRSCAEDDQDATSGTSPVLTRFCRSQVSSSSSLIYCAEMSTVHRALLQAAPYSIVSVHTAVTNTVRFSAIPQCHACDGQWGREGKERGED